MVLTARRGLGIALSAALAAAACNHSLFDNRPGGGSAGSGSDAGSDGPGVPASCPAGCLGDAAADFDGSATGMTHVWRYLEDQGRSWQAMTLSNSTMTGQIDPANRITTCENQKGAPACAALPDALLMSSGTSAVDPAIEFTTPTDRPAQVIQLILHAYLASGTGQTIRIYRNSREDLLFTSPLTATSRVDHAVVVDALPGDRFLVAISGDAAASEVGLQLYVNATGLHFPNSCQLALSFAGVNTTTTTTVQDPCSKYTFTSLEFTAPPPAQTFAATPFVPGPGPYPEQMPGVSVGQGMFLQRDGAAPMNALDWSHDTTVQLWAQPTMLDQLKSDSFLFDDFDIEACGGVELSVGEVSGTDPHITLHGCTDPVTMADSAITPAPFFPPDSAWHFVRVVRNAAGFDLCIDGVYVASLPVKPGPIASNNPPDLGKPLVYNEGASYVGGVDDVRVFTAALPCR
ncbi:MAG TPA: LamG-like jellyroll fold domain-containing protein [Kofleriaceae bacterium]